MTLYCNVVLQMTQRMRLQNISSTAVHATALTVGSVAESCGFSASSIPVSVEALESGSHNLTETPLSVRAV